ncbi:WecB/TagA/CpsF family glycosyltransferase [Schnuerera sp. xch1]|uniref:WecB/TagA/CpsF family glycosyltransferase n=1 Tax=Schnuerera sp. xch1 TaxID=2874283 RepID=UPI001CBE443F|nr:WecB/TagA/CpsF family glycosyltransferase [Schnuerera sp. xch1]MBZ2176031.1 WecB/TagA/CpsF family glycosyltransferase [Schnuerera sp. xch1]
MEKVKIFGVEIDNVTFDEATEIVKDFFKENKLNTICTPNTEIVMAAKEDDSLRDLINKNDLVIPDGIGLIYGSRIGNKPLKERVTGFDLSIKILEIANKEGYSIFLLGGKEGIAQKAGENIVKQYPNIKLLGSHHGYFKGCHIGYNNHEEELKVLDEINELKPDIIFVGLGFPKQEIWISENKDRLNGNIIIGNGGTIDILSGSTNRAPEVFQRLGLEWFYRLVQEPSRIRRQIVLPKFILSVLFNKDIVE